MIDVTILTDERYTCQSSNDPYVKNILLEDKLVADALEKLGLSTTKVAWDDPDFDWSSTRTALFRTTWDYFDKYPKFKIWMEQVTQKTTLINSERLILWNRDKHYLNDIASAGVAIPPSKFINVLSTETLAHHCKTTDWNKFILKPTVSGAARHTYLFDKSQTEQHEEIFATLLKEEDMMLQEFQHKIIELGEVSIIMINGNYTHSVLKKSKGNDFRVQDDFGGTVHDYQPSDELITMAKKCLKACPEMPLYARVDIMWDNEGKPVLSELELIEPELWFRLNEGAADDLAHSVKEKYF